MHPERNPLNPNVPINPRKKTEVVHVKSGAFNVKDPTHVYSGTRDEVIQKYSEWIITQPDLMAEVKELKGKRLGCWCAPTPCHGDVLKALADES